MRCYRGKELFDVAGREPLRPRIPYQELERLIQKGRTIPLHRILKRQSVHIVLDEFPAVRLSPDSKNDSIPGAAIAGNADLIVSGDKRDMLVLKTVSGMSIVAPRETLDGIAAN